MPAGTGREVPDQNVLYAAEWPTIMNLLHTGAGCSVAYLLMGLTVDSNLLQLNRDGGKWGEGYLCPTICHHPIDCIKAGSCVRHFNVSLIVRVKSQNSVH